jgi:hypothetical protein
LLEEEKLLKEGLGMNAGGRKPCLRPRDECRRKEILLNPYECRRSETLLKTKERVIEERNPAECLEMSVGGKRSC